MAASTAANTQPFEVALKNFKASLSVQQQNDFQSMTLDRLTKDIAELQEKQGDDRKLQNLTRLSLFLEGMRQYEGILDLFVNVSPFVAFIWGPIKFLLRTASTYVEAFDALLDAYQKIGETLPLLERYKDVFRGQRHMSMVLTLIYEDILKFHQRALDHFKGRKWKKLFRSLWKTFQTEFSRIISNLAAHERLIHSHSTVIHFEEFRRHRESMEEEWRLLQEDQQLKRRIAVQDWLNADNANEQRRCSAEPRQDFPQTGRWLLSMELFKIWAHPDVSPAPVLWLTGRPGSGKTVLATVAIDELRSKGLNVIYFFCKYKDPKRNSFIAVAKSLLLQLLALNPTILAYLYEEQASSGETVLTSPESAMDLLETAIGSANDIHVVLDGIDECPPKEMETLFSWFLNLSRKGSSSQSESIRCLFISQDEKVSRKHLRLLPKLKIQPKNSLRDISAFVDVWKGQLQKKFSLETCVVNGIADKLIELAEGMFLFVTLVSENLYSQGSQNKVLFEAGEVRFPKDLDEAYSRILHRILDESECREDVQWLLECLVCAKRPIRWHEFQGTITIDLDNQSIDFEGRRLVIDDAIELGGSIVELNPSGTIELVHRTAETYLVKEKRVVKAQAEFNLAKLCLGYLSFRSLDAESSEDDFLYYAKLGHYAFLEYAVAHWHQHVQSALAAGQRGSSLEELSEYIDVFLETCSVKKYESSHKEPKVTKAWKLLEDKPYFDQLIWTLYATKKQLQATGPSAARNEALSLHETLEHARKAIESLALTTEPLELAFESLYGDNIFKCPRINCRRFHDGYPRKGPRNIHVESHDRPYKCTFDECSTRSFVSQRSLDAHLSVEHNINTSSDEDFPSLDILKRQLESIEDPLESTVQPKVEESNLKCTVEGCEKSFTRRHNLVNHQRSHSKSDAQPFACSWNSCNARFARHHDRKRHEAQHAGERVVCGGTLQCEDGTAVAWGCKKDFSRPDYLKAHFRTEVGKACIAPLLEYKARMGHAQEDLDFPL